MRDLDKALAEPAENAEAHVLGGRGGATVIQQNNPGFSRWR
jgi:hypothetical protein